MGGKFANGAITGAFSRLFNDELHPIDKSVSEEPSLLGFLREEGLNVLYRTATTIGGVGQILLGGAICTTGIGCAGGAALVTLGASNIQEGLTGQSGFVREGATMVLGNTAGNLVVDTMNIASSGAGLLRPVVKPGTFKLFANIPSDFVPAYRTATTTGLAADVFSGTVGVADTLSNYYDE